MSEGRKRYRDWNKDGWDDEPQASGPAFKRLSRQEAQALVDAERSVSPWRVVGVQCVLGVMLALLAASWFGEANVAWSALYGAAIVAVPGALMARGMTSRLTRSSPGAGAVGFMVWEMLKVALSVVMLLMAPRIVPGLSWPMLLVALVVCIKVYWVALLWRGPRKTTSRRG
jgi:ATP synthase protein I